MDHHHPDLKLEPQSGRYCDVSYTAKNTRYILNVALEVRKPEKLGLLATLHKYNANALAIF